MRPPSLEQHLWLFSPPVTGEEARVLERWGGGSRPQLYRWREDPGDTRSLASEHTRVVKRFSGGLLHRSRSRAQEQRGEEVDLSRKVRGQLEQLGYLVEAEPASER